MTIEEINDLFGEVLDKVWQLKDNCCSDLQYYSDRNIELLRDYNDLVDSHNNNVVFNIISLTIWFCIWVLVCGFC